MIIILDFEIFLYNNHSNVKKKVLVRIFEWRYRNRMIGQTNKRKTEQYAQYKTKFLIQSLKNKYKKWRKKKKNKKINIRPDVYRPTWNVKFL